jgi:hypothetical protein
MRRAIAFMCIMLSAYTAMADVLKPATGGSPFSVVTGQIPFADSDTSIVTEESGFAWDAANNRLGIGDDTPDAKFDLEAGTLTDGVPAHILSATMPTTIAASRYGMGVLVTGAGSSAFEQWAFTSAYLAGYTGSKLTAAVRGVNNSVSGGSNQFGTDGKHAAYFNVNGTSGSGAWNFGAQGHAATNGLNVGLLGRAEGGSHGVGVMARSSGATTTMAMAAIAGSSDIGFNNTTMLITNTNAAIPLLRVEDSGSLKMIIEDGGEVGIGGDTTPDAKLEVTEQTGGGSEIFVSNEVGADPVLSFGATDSTRKFAMGVDNSTTNDDFVLSAGGTLGTTNVLSVDGSTRVVTVSSEMNVTSANNVGTCTLDGASPSACTATVTAGATCVCSPVATNGDNVCVVNLSGTTLTLYGVNGSTTPVNYICF